MKLKLLSPSPKMVSLAFFCSIFFCAHRMDAASFGPKEKTKAGVPVPGHNAPASVQDRVAKPVSGKVTDEKGLPMVGVSVSEQGTKTVTLTDANGAYTIQVAGESSVLLFTYIGYKTKSMPVSGKSVINVSIEPDASELSEVVVTALNIKRETKKLGYAAQNVKVDEITTNRTTNMANSLGGKIAGLDITPPASGPGSSTKIRLRGQSSFSGDNSPLIVLNGLPLTQSASGSNSYTQNTDLGDNLQQINPDDIETMTVLKGATAAALYGSLASNGAILITTKNGSKSAGIGVEFSSNYSADQALDYTDFQYEYGQGENNVRPKTVGEAQSSGGWSFGEKFDGKPTYQFDGVMRPYLPERNRISKFFRVANGITNTLALSGGGEKGSFRASYSKQYAEGVIPNNDYTKDIANIGLNYSLTPKFTAQVNLNYAHEYNDNPPLVGIQGSSIPTFIYRFANSISLDVLKAGAVNEQGNETPTSRFSTLTNPYWIMPRQFSRQRKDKLLGTASLRYQFYDWLYLQTRVSMDYSTDRFEQNFPTGGRDLNPAPAGQFNGSYRVNNGGYRSMNMDFLVGGSHKWGDFSFDANFGGNTLPYSNYAINASTQNFFVRDVYSIANGVTTTSAYTMARSKVNSLYGTAEFGYKSFLYVNITGRNDWFSVLSPQNNHYFYPSVSGSFVFSELMKDKAEWLNFGKLRLAYAEVGSANGIGPYSNVLTFGLQQNLYNGTSLGLINNVNVPNPALKPYSVREKEIGLELHFLNNRINLDVAAYDKLTTDQILSVAISNASGYTGSTFNLGSLKNKGIEFSLDVVPVKTNNFTWRTNLNTAANKTKVIELAQGQKQLNTGNGEFFGAIVHEVGLPLSQIQGSDYRRDANGRIITIAGKPVASTSPVLFGSALPTATGGWTNTFKYKKVSLLVQIDYKAGGKMLSSTNLNAVRQGLSKESLVGREGGVVFPGFNLDGTPNTTAVNAEDFYANYRSQNILAPFIYNASFVKLRNISASYDFSDLVKTTFIKSLVLSAVCRNVLMIKKYVPNIDPEAMQSSSDNLTGYEQASVPTTRTYGLNLNVKF